MLSFLLDRNHVDSRLVDLVQVIPPAAVDALFVEPSIEERVVRLVERVEEAGMSDPRLPRALLYGPNGVGRRELALKACARLGCRLVTVDVKALLRQEQDFEHLMRLAFREGLLLRAAIYSRTPRLSSVRRPRLSSRRSLRTAGEYGWLAFMAGEEPWVRPGCSRRHCSPRSHCPCRTQPCARQRGRRTWRLIRRRSPGRPRSPGNIASPPARSETPWPRRPSRRRREEEPSRLELADLSGRPESSPIIGYESWRQRSSRGELGRTDPPA